MPARGQPAGWTDDDLDELATISLRDLDEARAYWAANVPRRYRRALDGNGSDQDIERGHEALIAHGESVAGELAEAVLAGRIAVEEWQTLMMRAVINQTLCGLAVGKGGWANITASDLEAVRVGTEELE